MNILIAIILLVFLLRALEFVQLRKFFKKNGQPIPTNFVRFERQNRSLFNQEEKRIVEFLKIIILLKWIAMISFICLFFLVALKIIS